LARAREAYAIEGSALEGLLAEGYSREPVGDELEPRRSYLFVPAERAEKVATRRVLLVRMGAELLAAPHVMLVPFDDEPLR
jgi:hypothetical protein